MITNTSYGDYDNFGSNKIREWFFLSPGTYSFRAELWEVGNDFKYYKVAEQTITFYVKFKLSYQNNFSAGVISVNGATQNSPYFVDSFIGDAVTVGAIDQQYINQSYLWNSSGTNNSNWQKYLYQGTVTNILGATSRNYTHIVANDNNGASIITDLKKICNITFQNSFTSVGTVGVINVNGTQYNSPATGFSVIEQNPITATEVDQVYNGITYSFSHWSDGSTSYSKTFYPGDNTTYTAYYTGKPSNNNRNLHITAVVNQSPVITWTDNVNSNVTQYQIWRYVKDKNTGDVTTSLLTTVNRGVQSYTDYDYVITSGYTVDLLKYDVRGYYSVENTYADEAYTVAVYGRPGLKQQGEKDTLSLITNYSIECYPNPFNPSTTIRYQLPKYGYVTLKVYDIVGNEVKTLVNGYRSSGSYAINFDASSLASGIYFYRIQTNDYFAVKKMILTK